MVKCRLGEKISTVSFQQLSTQLTSEQDSNSPSTAKLTVAPAISGKITMAKLLQILKVAKNDSSFASC